MIVLNQRRWVGGSVGYYRWEVLETFEDRELAEKELSNLTRNGHVACLTTTTNR